MKPEYGGAYALAIGPILYAIRNATEAIVAFPIGALSDRIGRRGLLVVGYLVGVLTMLGFLAAFAWEIHSLAYVIGLFVGAGVCLAFQEALESAMTADLIPDRSRRGTAYGVLGCVNGVGDFAASFVVGLLIAVRPEWAFAYAAGWMFLGAGAMALVRPSGRTT